MQKHEKVKFDDLEKLGEGGPEPFSETDLLGLLEDREKLEEVMKSRKLEFMSTLFIKLSQSADFRGKVKELLLQKKA